MEEKENPKEKLIQQINIANKARNNSKSEVQIIQKSIKENLLCCCINYDLTVSEYKSFVELRKKVIPEFDEKDSFHELALQTLLSNTKEILSKNKDKDKESSDIISNDTITTKASSSNNNKLEDDSKLWRKIGFQTNNPRTDFRAGGIFSLDLMNYFVVNYENEYINIINEDFFTFALVCIRVSYLIRIYLFLLSSDELKINLKYQKNILASRKELKTFCYFLYDNNNLLFEISCTALKFIYQKFVEQKCASNKENNYFIIDPIILSAVQCLKNAINNMNNNSDFISELKINFRENFLKELK